MKIEYMIPSCLVGLIVFIVLITMGRANYLEATKSKFSLKSMFPFEMQNLTKAKYNWYVRFVALFFALAMALFAINAFDMSFGSILGFATGAMIINAIVMMLLFIVDMRRASLHMAFAICHFILTFLSYAFVANYVFFAKSNQYPIVLGIICIVLAIIIFLLLLNPKLYRWMYLEKVEEDGVQVLKRPKVVVLSLYEWIFMGLSILLNFIITIVTIFM